MRATAKPRRSWSPDLFRDQQRRAPPSAARSATSRLALRQAQDDPELRRRVARAAGALLLSMRLGPSASARRQSMRVTARPRRSWSPDPFRDQQRRAPPSAARSATSRLARAAGALLLSMRLGPHPQALLARRLRASLGPQALFFLLPSFFLQTRATCSGMGSAQQYQGSFR